MIFDIYFVLMCLSINIFIIKHLNQVQINVKYYQLLNYIILSKHLDLQE